MTPAQRFPDVATRPRGWATAGVLVLALALAGCAPAAVPAPTESAAPAPPPSETPSASPSPAALALPATCEEAVPIAWIKANFGDAMELISFDPTGGGPVSRDFAARGGLVCFWGLPRSDGGFTLSIAQRATATDAEQVAIWEAAGYELGPDFLDALWFEQGPTEVSENVTTYVLVSGWEIQTDGFGVGLDPYLSLIRQATDSMGYL